MTDTFQPNLTAAQLEKLQGLRAAVLAFQNKIAALPATETDNGLNEQFNDLRLETKSLLKDPAFDKKVSLAVTEETLAGRFQQVMMPRLFAIITLGVILVLLGLGVNSIILEDLIVNTMGCLVSSAGLLLVIGAFAVFLVNQSRRQLSNYGELYQYTEALLSQIDQALAIAIPGWAERSEADKLPAILSVDELRIDSLRKQGLDWQQKLNTLEAQRSVLGEEAPTDLAHTIEFAQKELDRIHQEILLLEGPKLLTAGGDAAEAEAATVVDETERVDSPTPPSVPAVSPAAEPPAEEETRQKAQANTLGMPVSTKAEEESSESAVN